MKTCNYLEDTAFRGGFKVHGPHHEDGYWATYPGDEGVEQRWELCEWGTYKHPLDPVTPRTDTADGFHYDTPSCTVSVPGEEGDVRLELRTTREYEGYIRKEGEDWPHLLAQQGFRWQQLPALGELKELRYHAQFRLAYCDNHMDMTKFVPTEHFAQTHHYFTCNDVQAGDYFWFGIPYFDTRYPLFPGYLNIDKGKADATGKMIRTVPQPQLTDTSVLDGKWVTYDFDMLPLLREAYDTAKEAGVLAGCEFDRMVLTGTNIGFEMFAEFDAAIEMRDMSLTGVLK